MVRAECAPSVAGVSLGPAVEPRFATCPWQHPDIPLFLHFTLRHPKSNKNLAFLKDPISLSFLTSSSSLRTTLAIHDPPIANL
jgi:hypothetical protein